MCDRVLAFISNSYPFLKKLEVDDLKLIPVWTLIIATVLFFSVKPEPSQFLIVSIIIFTLLMPVIFSITLRNGYKFYDDFYLTDLIRKPTKNTIRSRICIGHILSLLTILTIYFWNFV